MDGGRNGRREEDDERRKQRWRELEVREWEEENKRSEKG